jgi:outer membrane lipoprotein-sorting protein
LRKALIEATKVFVGLGLAALLLATPACLVRKVTHTHPPSQAAPALDASLAELEAKIDAWSAPIQTMTATVDLEPTAGSVYSGVIKEYHDVKGFVLLQKPSILRLLGQAPVVRTNIFDMVSTGDEFRLYLPIQQKFVVGKTTVQYPAKNALENLRPQHILQAVLVPSFDSEHEAAFQEKFDQYTEGKRYYIVDIVETLTGQHLRLLRKVWFDRSDLKLVRVQSYDADGTCTEDVRYSNYADFKNIHYPARIALDRPEDDYQVVITIEKATFNEPIPPEKFDLKKPEGVEVIDLRAPRQGAEPVDK